MSTFKRRTAQEVQKEHEQSQEKSAKTPQQEALKDSSPPQSAPDIQEQIDESPINPEALMAELEALGEDGLGALLGSKRPKRFRSGDEVSGAISRIEKEFIFIDIGGKSEGVLSRSESGVDSPKLGQVITARVIRSDSRGIRLAKRLSQEGGFEALQSAYELKMPVDIKITGRNKGGYELRAFGQKGFCPLSQISLSLPTDLDELIGQTLSFQITQIGSREFSASRRILLEAEAAELKQKRLLELETGMIVEGSVEAVHHFGAFISLDGISGLLPKRSFRRIHGEISVGQKLEVEIVSINSAEQKVLVEPLYQDPWKTVTQSIKIGSSISGTIESKTDFGFFVKLDIGITGLAHQNNIDPELWRTKKEGDNLSLFVSSIDTDRRRLSLSSNEPKEQQSTSVSSTSPDSSEPFTLGNILGDIF
ncbi:MAG: hypothetical protein CMK59_13020 [Proteobacteria bacterium]|nr:hypothetical protein [Pseudomonadota bacterium]